MASSRFEWVDLRSIWKPEVVYHPKFKATTALILEEAEFVGEHSWLLQTIYEDRYAADEEEDDALLERFGKVEFTHYAWYLALQQCDKYALVIGTALEVLLPEQNWEITYTPDHYFCILRASPACLRTPDAILVVDLLGQCRIEAGLTTSEIRCQQLETRWNQHHIIRSIPDHLSMVMRGEYDL